MNLLLITLLLATSSVWPACPSRQNELVSQRKTTVSLDQDRSKLARCNNLCEQYAYQPDSVKKYSAIGLLLAKKLNDKMWLQKMYYKSGIAQMNLDLPDSALVNFKLAEEIAIERKDKKQLGGIYRGMGISLYHKQDFEAAIQKLTRAIAFYQESGSYTDIPTCYSVIGSVYSSIGNRQKHIEYNVKAIKLLERLKADKSKKYSEAERYQMETNYVDFNGNLANGYFNTGKNKEAIYYYNKALSIGEKGKNINAYVLMLANASGCYDAIKNTLMRDSLVNRSLRLARKYDLKTEEANALDYLGYYSRRLSQAKRYFSQSLKIARSINHQVIIKTIYLDFTSKAEEFGNFKLALENYRHYVSLKDSMVNAEQLTRIANLESTFKLKETENRLKQTEISSLKKSYRIKWFLTASILLFLALLGTVMFTLHIRKLHSTLKIKTMQLAELNGFKSRVFSIIGHDVSGAISSMSATLHVLKTEGQHVSDFGQLMDQLINLKENAFDMLNKLFVWGSAEVFTYSKMDLVVPRDIQNTIQMAKNLCSSKNIQFNCSTFKEIPVKANQEHLEFIIRNLLTNAIKYSTEQRGVSLDVSQTKSLIKIDVINYGVAINREKIKHLFANKIQSEEGTHAEKGSGTGLALCKRIADIEGFHLYLAYAEEGLTKFTLAIPTGGV